MVGRCTRVLGTIGAFNFTPQVLALRDCASPPILLLSCPSPSIPESLVADLKQ